MIQFKMFNIIYYQNYSYYEFTFHGLTSMSENFFTKGSSYLLNITRGSLRLTRILLDETN